MARYKLKKTSHFIDMTAFSGVVFTLLSFMIFCGKPKALGGFITMPTVRSRYVCGLNGGGGALVVFLKGEKTFIGFDDDNLKRTTLQWMCRKYKVDLTSAETEVFNNVEVFGDSINNLKNFLVDGASLNNALRGTGIPSDKKFGDQLADWIAFSQKANNYINGVDPRVAIIADKDVPYPFVKHIIDNMQHYGINRFTLINYASLYRSEME